MKGGSAREAVEDEVDYGRRDAVPPTMVEGSVQVAFLYKCFDDGDKARAQRGRGCGEEGDGMSRVRLERRGRWQRRRRG